jgi:serine/threonine-protein kinase RsbW
MAQQILFSASARLENVSLIGAAVRGICSSLSNNAQAYQFELCVVEACNNIVEHAFQYDETQQFTVQVTVEEHTIVLEVRYQGKEFAPAFVSPELMFDPLDCDTFPEGGMGLILIHQFMDKVEYNYEHGINRMVMTKELQNPFDQMKSAVYAE